MELPSPSPDTTGPSTTAAVSIPMETTTESDEEKMRQILESIWPKPQFWVLIVCHLIVFVVGLIGNALVCIAVCRNHTMRTVTNIFIVNLAVADFLVLLFCMPLTVPVDITQTWFFGSVCCKVITSLQMMSVAVSVLTLAFISLDRWYALCHPLRFRATARWAKKAIALIWILSIMIGTPYMVWSEVHPYDWSPKGTVYFSSCATTWGAQMELYSAIFNFVCLYLLPLCFMLFTYCQIVRVLWKPAIPGHPESRDYSAISGSDGRNSSHGGSGHDTVSAHIRSRRKAAKMLVVVVIIFAFCLLCVHLIIVIRAALGESWKQEDDIKGQLQQAAVCIAHWLFYFNSAVNPIIYNFMSSKFRREFVLSSRCHSRVRLAPLRACGVTCRLREGAAAAAGRRATTCV
ncbi:orexin receptor type 2-like isoform X2 [Amphibalanus amphitrite]|uniref:orexin receptor type 2-like isoform X2 n=1 Tax=Amphibalanus amphitrite TaxID=1232801 RepID=UPI001C8FC91E|nr:orexin receptor type 2-like isoform X2 [Amphibalanus amphitrite]